MNLAIRRLLPKRFPRIRIRHRRRLRAGKQQNIMVCSSGRDHFPARAMPPVLLSCRRKNFLENAGKISICFEIPHESGSLYNILSHMIYNNLNMTKIESRPIPERNWEYRFFVDFEGNLKRQRSKECSAGHRAGDEAPEDIRKLLKRGQKRCTRTAQCILYRNFSEDDILKGYVCSDGPGG